jgi:hypothetical protein
MNLLQVDNFRMLGMSHPPGNCRLHSHPSVQHSLAYVTHNCDCVERNGNNGEKGPKQHIGNNNALIEKGATIMSNDHTYMTTHEINMLQLHK